MEISLTVILFYVFSVITVISAVAVISARNPVYSVLWLIFAFFNAAGLFLLLGAEMLAMLLVIVYVGAVAVLFLFVVMMLNIKTASLKKNFQSYLPIGIILAGILFLEISAITYNASNKLDIKTQKVVTETIGEFSQDASYRKVNKNTNAHQIGNVMYTDYILYFQTCGLILFVAMIGAIVLTLRNRTGVRKQVITDQYKRNMKNSLRVVSVETGAGVK